MVEYELFRLPPPCEAYSGSGQSRRPAEAAAMLRGHGDQATEVSLESQSKHLLHGPLPAKVQSGVKLATSSQWSDISQL